MGEHSNRRPRRLNEIAASRCLGLAPRVHKASERRLDPHAPPRVALRTAARLKCRWLVRFRPSAVGPSASSPGPRRRHRQSDRVSVPGDLLESSVPGRSGSMKIVRSMRGYAAALRKSDSSAASTISPTAAVDMARTSADAISGVRAPDATAVSTACLSKRASCGIATEN